MNTSSPSRRNVLLTIVSALGLMLLPFASLRAADAAPALPLAPSFEKLADGGATPFVLHLKNTSHETLKVSGKVLLSVVNHSMDKARVLPEQSVKAGEVMSVAGLVPEDKVVVTAPGYAPLEVKVPFKL